MVPDTSPKHNCRPSGLDVGRNSVSGNRCSTVIVVTSLVQLYICGPGNCCSCSNRCILTDVISFSATDIFALFLRCDTNSVTAANTISNRATPPATLALDTRFQTPLVDSSLSSSSLLSDSKPSETIITPRGGIFMFCGSVISISSVVCSISSIFIVAGCSLSSEKSLSSSSFVSVSESSLLVS
ncbi:hypothetical protein L798_15444 [Zootermopsis nevadensis]|uniref:Uncharacterized protein n=1 Tax=Zootermopsis nevadensis TaxID=136037 RepID=A0A067RRC4_ZOONE|nr:hypothetical protein L798_15444 [Zootermopsis nevadensis]